MKNKKIKDPFGFNKAINYDKLNDPKILKTLEEIFKDKPTQYEKLKDPHDAPYRENEKQPTHNECADCGETIRHDQCSSNHSRSMCIDCG